MANINSIVEELSENKNNKFWEGEILNPWEKEIIEYAEKQFFLVKSENIIPKDSGIYMFFSDKHFHYPYGKSGVYYIGKAKNLKSRLKNKLTGDWGSKYNNNNKSNGLSRYVNIKNGINHYYPYLNYYQKFSTKLFFKEIKSNDQKKIKQFEDILISAFYAKMGNRPAANRTGPNQSIWTDVNTNKKLIKIYDQYLSNPDIGD